MNLEEIFNNIEGQHTYPRIYTDMVNRFPSGSIFVEVGSFWGKSLTYLLMEAEKAGKVFDITTIDSFVGVKEYPVKDLRKIFHKNTRLLKKRFKFLEMDSIEASGKFKDNSIDFVFIDANHMYSYVKSDILAWLPKVKKGGVIAGHDYGPTYCGVMQATGEVFGKRLDLRYADEYCWMYENNT